MIHHIIGTRRALIQAGVLLLTVAAACSSPAQTPSPVAVNMGTATAASFTDPFAYCASVRNIDKPDARYAGAPIPDAIINGYRQAAGLTSSTEPMDQLRQSTIWRCMDGAVYACNFGANLPCDSKANTNSTPSPDEFDYCGANPNADFIPMSYTGHATVYAWKCVNGRPQSGDPVSPVVGRGYLQQIWLLIHPAP